MPHTSTHWRIAFNVVRDDPDLSHRPEQPAHRLLRFLVETDIRQIPAGFEARIVPLTGLSNHGPAKLHHQPSGMTGVAPI
jgi:hypothetical protein